MEQIGEFKVESTPKDEKKTPRITISITHETEKLKNIINTTNLYDKVKIKYLNSIANVVASELAANGVGREIMTHSKDTLPKSVNNKIVNACLLLSTHPETKSIEIQTMDLPEVFYTTFGSLNNIIEVTKNVDDATIVFYVIQNIRTNLMFYYAGSRVPLKYEDATPETKGLGILSSALENNNAR